MRLVQCFWISACMLTTKFVKQTGKAFTSSHRETRSVKNSDMSRCSPVFRG